MMKKILLLPLKAITFILNLPFKLLALVVGRLSWSAPGWFSAVNQFRRDKGRVFWGIVAVLVIVATSYLYYDSLPQPIMVKGDIQAPANTENYEGAKPNSLYIEFSYDLSRLKSDQERPEGAPSAARIDLVGEAITSGISISPAKKGKWVWADDRSIRFDPETDWPAGTKYKVVLDKSIFSKNTKLSDDTYTFETKPFVVGIRDIEFYQDPEKPSVRKIVATIGFSHPVDKASFEKSITLKMRPSGSTIDIAAKAYKFEVSYDKNQREAYIHSEPVTLPQEPNYMLLSIDDGVKTILGGAASEDEAEDKILIPDITSFLKVESAEIAIIRNQKNEPEQIVTLEFTDDMAEQEVLTHLSLYELPGNSEPQGKNYWSGPREVSDAVLASSKKIDIKMIPNERSSSKLFSFFIDVPENRYIYLKVDKGFKSVNQFVHASLYDSILRAPKYPKEIKIAGDGSLLTYSGDHKLSVLTRGVPGVKFTVGKLLEDQLYHLISQTNGDINNPRFSNWSFDKENIAEMEEEYVDINAEHPKTANYAALNLSKYLPKNRNRFGLFFVDAKAWDKQANRELYGTNDSRLILVTDLGLIVKNNVDKTHDVFVQSIHTGLPVEGATVELLGKNGLPIYTRKTAGDGHVLIPSTNDFKQEKTPTVYVVKTDADISFIPFDRYSRQINISRFDIGGVSSNDMQADSLNGFVFTDRGIYRPGETVSAGFIVKNFNLTNVAGIPLEVVISGPRSNEVKVSRITLPEKGFFDFQYATESSSDTGKYQISLHLVRDNKYRGNEIGSAEFKVEEFQPDTMKIESKLVDVGDIGWSTKEKISANVFLKNLFGVPAQERKMTGRIIITPASFSFKKYEDYTFTDPTLSKDKRPLNLDEYLEERKTDVDGKANFDIDLQRFREGTYNIQFIAEGFDQGGGRSVVAANTALISPLSHLIGYKADGNLGYINLNSKRNIKFISIDNQLNKTRHENLQLKLLAIQTLSTLVKQNNGTYKYQSIKKENEIRSENISIPQAEYEYLVDTKSPGQYALELYDAEKKRLARVDYTVVGSGNLAGKIDKNAELQLKLNKEDYLPGETIEMSINAPYSGAGLISIETDTVKTFKWFKTDKESSIQSIKVPQELEGTAYVNVAFVRDITSREIFTSPLSYAVQPFSIDKSKRTIKVGLDVKEIVRPGKPMKIGYKTSKSAKVAVFAVDEGILQVAKYQTPDPLGHFLKKRALDVQTIQILDLILPDFDLLKELSASGGDSRARAALAKNLNPFARSVDKPAVFWSGIVDGGADMQYLSFDVPDTFSGSLVVFAVAVGDDAMGVAKESSIVRGPFVISPNVLTQAAPGDEFLVTVGVANIVEGSGKNADVAIEVTPSPQLEVVGNKISSLKIDEGGEAKATFKVKVKNMLGAAELRFTARHKEEDFSRTASLSIRPATVYYSSFSSGFDADGKVELGAGRTLYAELSKQKVSASASPLVLVDGLTAYLETFPHGCTEQVVSKVFPLVGLMTHPAYAPHVKEVNNYFTHLIDKLRERQLSDGSFAFWPGVMESAEYPTIYVMHFLVESRDLGYPVPNDMINRGKDYLVDYVGRSPSNLAEARNRANAIYLLTRLGETTTNYLVDLEEYLEKNQAKKWKKDLLSSYMAATYKLLLKDKEADQLISGYKLDSKPDGDMDDFHSLLARDAQYVYLVSKHFPDKAADLKGEQLLKLTEKIFRGEYNTISSAYSILALGAYSKLALEDKFDEAIVFSALEKGVRKNLSSELKPFPTANYSVTQSNLGLQGNKALFYLNTQSGFDTTLPNAELSSGLEIHRDFLDDKGNKVTSFAQGKELNVRLRIRALDDKLLTNIAIIDLLPGGFEVVRSSVSRTANDWLADYIDVREDRMVYYGSFGSNVTDLTYRVKLTSAGEFVIPPSFAESMYDRSVRAISKPGRFIVKAAE